MLTRVKKLFLSQPFTTENGFVFKKPEVAYEEYGNPKGEVVVITHGGLQNMHMAGKYDEKDKESGAWDAIIGENKAIDTRRFRVIAPNSLGSFSGTTSPLTINPDTNKPYGKDFPEITMIDMVRFLKLFLDELGVTKLFLIAGPSMGALQALQMAALYPDFVENAIGVACSGRLTPGALAIHLFFIQLLENDKEFQGGNYQPGQCLSSLKILNQVARIYYTHERTLKFFYDNVEKNSYQLRQQAINYYLNAGIEEQIKNKDPNCYIRLLKAINTYDLSVNLDYEGGVRRIICPLLLINFTTDSEFPPSYAKELQTILNSVRPGQVDVVELDSMWGHIGCIKEAPTIATEIKKFLQKRGVEYENGKPL